jgi:Mor family transcriptional regulator
VAQSNAKAEKAGQTAAPEVDEEEIAYLAKRHRVSPAIVREIIRRSGASERSAIEREIQKGKARR